MRPPRARRDARRAGTLLSALGLLLLAAGCSRDGRPRAAQAETPSTPADSAQPPASAGLHGGAIASAEAERGDWVRPAKNFASTRYSGLTQITAANVQRLGVAWTFSTGVLRGQEAAPIVAENTMFVVTPYPNVLYALDLTKPGAPLKWKYEPHPDAAAQGVACCDVVNRGAVYDAGKVFISTLDNHVAAVDARTGKELWKTKLGEINLGETITMAPLVVKGKVLVGNSGGELGVRGWLTALDENTGKIAWRAYGTGPDKEVLIGSSFKPFYGSDSGKDLGVRTWVGDQWKIGGATAWGWISYDPDLDLIYYGTSNPGSWNPDLRPGDNKWGSTVFARRPETGEAIWAHQWNPHDLWDYDSINEGLLMDLPIGGKVRKVLVRPERNGYIYVYDRQTGEILSADPFVHINTTLRIDVKTGLPVNNTDKKPGTGYVQHDVCPASPGGKDWQPSAFSPRTGLLYVPHQNICMDYGGVEAGYIAGTPYVGTDVKMYAGPGGYRGEFMAWDPVARRKAWAIQENFPVWSGALVTAGDVAFYGTMDGWFKAVDARTGKLLWQYKVGSGIIGQPVTYQGPDGKQYVAILSGVGGWPGAIVAADLDPRDSTAGGGFVNAMKDLPLASTKGGTLYVFALP